MVFGIVGKLGGGKSLTSVFYMINWLKQGDIVTTNIKLDEEYLKIHKIPTTSLNYLEDFSKVNPWSLPCGDLRGSGGKVRSRIVIDEAGEWCDSYSDARHKGQLSDIASWLRQSDKLGQDVYFIVQFENLLHARLRSIVHRWVVCVDVDKFRFPMLNLPLPSFFRKYCIASTYDSKGGDYIARQYIYKPSFYKAYNTSAFFGESYKSSLDADKVVVERTVKKYKKYVDLLCFIFSTLKYLLLFYVIRYFFID